MTTAIVVLATGEYWRGARVLFHTLHKHGGLRAGGPTPLVLGMDRCDFAEAVPITADYSWVPVSQRYFPYVADKLFALTLDFDRIIMLDADMLCVGDCSLLWSAWLDPLPFYAVRDVASGIYYKDRLGQLGLDAALLFNAGTMVFDRRRFAYRDFIGAIRSGALSSYDGGDQGYLNCWYQRSRQPFGWLPLEYNACTDMHYPRMQAGTAKLIHFTGGNLNPWAPTIAKDDCRWPLLERWQAEWKECSPAENPGALAQLR